MLKNSRFMLLAISAAVGGCNSPMAGDKTTRITINDTSALSNSEERRPQHTDNAIGAIYFPMGIIDPEYASVRATLLQLLGEPSIRNARVPPGATILRIWAYVAFRPMVAVRFMVERDRCSAVTTEIGQPVTQWSEPNSSGTSSPVSSRNGSILRHDSTDVSHGSCLRLVQEFQDAADWAGDIARPDVGPDGFELFMELRDANSHRVFYRFAPGDTARAFMLAGNHALQLGGVH